MKTRFGRIIASLLACLMIFTAMPVNAVGSLHEEKAISDNETAGQIMSMQADSFWEKLDEKEKNIEVRKSDVTAYMNAAYKLVSSFDEVTEISWEDEDTFNFTLNNSIPCTYDYRIRNIESSLNSEGIDKTEIISSDNDQKSGSLRGTNVVLFGPYYGYDSSFTNYYKNLASQIATAKGGNATIYSGTDATPAAVRRHVQETGNCVFLFDSHGTSSNGSSYVCVRSSTGITSNDYSQGWAISLSSGAYGIDGRFMCEGETKTVCDAFYWFATCLGMKYPGLSVPLVNSGANTVYGYSQSVTFKKDYEYAGAFWPKMLSGETVASAIASMKAQYGNYDNYGNPPAYPVVVSDEDAYPSNPDSVQNVTTTTLLMGEAFALTYDANGGANAPATQNNGATYTVSSQLPTRFPYTFNGWALTADAKEADYLPGDELTLEEDMTLYAVWTEATEVAPGSSYTYEVKFAGQGHFVKLDVGVTSEHTFTSAGSYDTAITLYDEQGQVVAENDDGGVGGNFELACGLEGGKIYYAKLVIRGNAVGTFGMSLTSAEYHGLIFDANGGENAPAAMEGGYRYTIPSQNPTRFGYNFLGWSRNREARQPEYFAGNVLLLEDDMILYAVWAEPITVTDGDNTIGGANAGGDRYVKFLPALSGAYTLKANMPISILDENGELLKGDGTMSTITYQFVAEKTYFIVYNGTAVFTVNIEKRTFTVQYNAYGGFNAPAAQTSDGMIIIPEQLPDRFGYTFKGWSTDNTATVGQYFPGQEVALEDSLVLYAIWQSAEQFDVYTDITVEFAKQAVFVKYVPKKDASYTFTASSKDTPNITVYGEIGTVLATGEGNMAVCELKANTTYFVKIELAEKKAGTVMLAALEEGGGSVIIASAGANGSISPSGVITISANGTIVFAITPNVGYRIADVNVDGRSVGAVDMYTFKNVSNMHTISVTFAESSKMLVTFKDGVDDSIVAVLPVDFGATLTSDMMPVPVAHVGYMFVGWDYDNSVITGDIVITAIYSGAGDVNGDGRVNTGDAVYVLKFAAEMVTLDDAQMNQADVNNDGIVNTGDAVMILRIIVAG